MNFKPITRATAVLAATRVSTQISVTVIFWSTFLQLQEESPLWKFTFGAFTCFIIIAYGVLDGFRHISGVLKSASLFLAVGYACTPILKTLTDTISTDTIYAMSALLMMLHIAFHRYGIDGSFVAPYLSLNAAVCGAICLASRLQETQKAFILLTLAVEAFALFPELYEGLGYSLIAFCLSFISAVFCLSSVSIYWSIVFLFVILIGAVNVVFPLFFVWAQKYKDNLHGPWDEVIPNLPGIIPS